MLVDHCFNNSVFNSPWASRWLNFYIIMIHVLIWRHFEPEKIDRKGNLFSSPSKSWSPRRIKISFFASTPYSWKNGFNFFKKRRFIYLRRNNLVISFLCISETGRFTQNLQSFGPILKLFGSNIYNSTFFCAKKFYNFIYTEFPNFFMQVRIAISLLFLYILRVQLTISAM